MIVVQTFGPLHITPQDTFSVRCTDGICGPSGFHYLNSSSGWYPVWVYESAQECLSPLILADVTVCKRMTYFIARLDKICPCEKSKRWVNSANLPIQVLSKPVAVGPLLPPFY